MPILQSEKLPFLVVERDRPRFEALRAKGTPVVFGDATVPGLLESAGVEHARRLLVEDHASIDLAAEAERR